MDLGRQQIAHTGQEIVQTQHPGHASGRRDDRNEDGLTGSRRKNRGFVRQHIDIVRYRSARIARQRMTCPRPVCIPRGDGRATGRRHRPAGPSHDPGEGVGLHLPRKTLDLPPTPPPRHEPSCGRHGQQLVAGQRRNVRNGRVGRMPDAGSQTLPTSPGAGTARRTIELSRARKHPKRTVPEDNAAPLGMVERCGMLAAEGPHAGYPRAASSR